MGIEINSQIIKNIFSTNTQEVLELVGLKFYLYIFICFSFLFLIYFTLIKHLPVKNLYSYLFGLLLIFSIFFASTKINFVFYKKFIKYDTAKIVPFNIILAISKYIQISNRNKNIAKNNISKSFIFDNKFNKPLVAVLVIGESARADRLHINGYQKNTTPNLDIQKNIVSFINASSCDTSTASSVPCLMSRATRDYFEFPIKEYSFIKIFRDFGFKTYFISLQNENDSILPICHEAEKYIDLSKLKYDTDSLGIIKNIISKINTNTLIVIHLMGSHKDYNERVPKKYQLFKPICNFRDYEICENQTLNNSYDNTIYHTDIFLSNIIAYLNTSNAFMIYTSDHGESLGENTGGIYKHYGHASPYLTAPIEQTHVPFIMWFSNIYIKNKHQKLNFDNKKPISHDNVFSTILGCSGFSGKYIDNNLNLCNNK